MALVLLLSCVALFVATHLGLSNLRLKAALVAKLGEKTFMGLYSLIALVTFGGAIYAYAGLGARGSLLFAPLGWSDPLVYVLMFLSILFFILSQGTPSPVGADLGMGARPVARGILRVTAHPQNWGMICFGLAHVLVTATTGGLALYGSLALLGIVGGIHETAKKRRVEEKEVRDFLAETAFIPFSAILRGKNRFVAGEFKLASLIVATLVFGLAIGAHFLL